LVRGQVLFSDAEARADAEVHELASGGWYAHLVAEDTDNATSRRLFQQARAELRRHVANGQKGCCAAHSLRSPARRRRWPSTRYHLTPIPKLPAGASEILRVLAEYARRGQEALSRHGLTAAD
jgi:hypothetical protein